MSVASAGRPLRICMICPEYPPGAHGGIGTFTQVMARALAARGHEVRVVGIYDATYAASDHEIDHGVRVWRLREPAHPMGWVRARFAQFRLVAAWAASDAIDLIEVPDYQGWAAGWPRLPVPVIARLHSSATYLAAELGRRLPRTVRWLEGASLRRADYWCAVSAYTARKTRALFGLAEPPGAILYNPVDVSAADGARPRSADVVFAGTLAENKGVVPLLRAWERIATAHPDARLHLYGKDSAMPDGASMHDRLRAMLPSTLAPTVHFHGRVPRERVLDAFRTARVAVLPSFAESFALAPLEALACGCPTIYTRRCSGPELIDDGCTGLLVDPADPAAIAAAILRVLEDDVLAARLGRAGAAHVHERFGLARILDENERFYRTCVDAFAIAPRGAESAA